MKLKRSKRIEELLDLKPVTDEEFKELLDDRPRREEKRGKKKKRREFEEFF